MSKIKWDVSGEHFYETGVKNGVLYLQNSDGTYGYDPNSEVASKKEGVAWNGLSSITESPSGAEASAIYADDTKYLNLYSLEEFGMSIEAYTYPDDFELCDGTAELATGAKLGQQERKTFGLCYRTAIGNDVDSENHGYKLHLVYGCKASPSERAYSTINDSPEAITFSWEITNTPIQVPGYKPTSIITIDSTKANETCLANLEKVLFGVDPDTEHSITEVKSYLPLPAKVKELLTPVVPDEDGDGDEN